MSEQETPPPPTEPAPGPAPEASAPPSPPDTGTDPEGPVLARTPGWVPAAVVAGVVLLVEGLIVSRIRPEGEAAAIVGDISLISMGLGLLSLVCGYFAYLLSRVPFVRTIEAFVLSGVVVVAYWWGWNVLAVALSGDSGTLLGVQKLGLAGKGAALGAVGWLVICVGIFAFSFFFLTRIVWPYFRAGVALNVLAMVHLVVLLLGVVSYLNLTFTPRLLGPGLDLTETGRFTLSDKTTAVLGKLEGQLYCYLVEFPSPGRSAAELTPRVRDLLAQYRQVTPKMEFRQFDALRNPTEFREALTETGMSDALDTMMGEEDCVLLGYRPPGDRLVARKKVVPITQEFSDSSALGNQRFKGEGILTNAMNEVVFSQRKVLFLEGHGEKPIGSPQNPSQSYAQMAEAFRSDNFAVSTRNLGLEPAVPEGTDVVIAAGPAGPLAPHEVEVLREYLSKGGALVLLLDPRPDATRTGLEGLLDSWGIQPRRDAVVVSYVLERTRTVGDVATPTHEVRSAKSEFAPHPAMEALRGSNFAVGFTGVLPVFRAEKPPTGVDVQELVFAPRGFGEDNELKPFGAILRPGRSFKQPEPGDIENKRLPLVVVAEKKSGEGTTGGGRLAVFGDADFASDLRVDPRSSYLSPANRNLLLNVVSWAVRRNVIAIDPKTVETEVVDLQPIHRDLAFWVAVVALPVIALGVAVGVWWARRR